MLLYALLVTGLLQGIVAPPVQEKPTPPPKAEDQAPLGLDYEHYLKEVISHLEGDKDFRKQLESANATEIQDGSIARHLQFVSHNVRSKLDEVKRREIERLRDLVMAQEQLHNRAAGAGERKPFKMPLHLDLKESQFNEEDLKKLIQETTKDLEKADREREKEFKGYEMEKEHLKRQKIHDAKTEEERKAMEKDYEESKKKHNEHEKFNHPGSKKQLEEVWEEDDKMDKEDFNPKTFFQLHDVNNDHYLDQAEVAALFQKELNKAYDADKSEDDMMERYEEMNRMREHVFKEFDKNEDGLISMEEFINATEKAEFEKPEEEYKPLEEEEVFTDEEFNEFEHEFYPTMRPQLQPSKAPPAGSSAHPNTPSEAELERNTPAPPEHHEQQQPVLDVQHHPEVDAQLAKPVENGGAEQHEQLKVEPAQPAPGQ